MPHPNRALARERVGNSRVPAKRRRQRLPVLAALVVFGVGAMLTPLRDLDLNVYLAAAERVYVVGVEPYTRTDGAGLPFTYPPTALFALRPLAGLTPAAASALLWGLNLALALLLMLLLPRDLARTDPSLPASGASPTRPTDAAPDITGQRLRAWGPLYIACFGGLYLNLHFQQVNLLLLLCLWGFWRVLRQAAAGGHRLDMRRDIDPAHGWTAWRASTQWLRQIGAGAALALGTVAKPHYGLLGLGLLGCLRVGRQPGAGLWLLLGAALGAAALLWLSLVIAPAGSWAAWWTEIVGSASFTALPPGHSSIAAPWNRSLAGELARWLVPNKFIAPVLASPPLAAGLATTLVTGLGLATGWAVAQSLRQRVRHCGQHCAGAPVAVDLELSLISVWVFLAAPASWTHHLVMLLPAALVLLRDGVLDPRADALGRLAAVLVLAVLALTLDDLLAREVRTGSRAIMALMTVAVLGLWALLFERLRRQTGLLRLHAALPAHR
jgi:hypothetical protein